MQWTVSMSIPPTQPSPTQPQRATTAQRSNRRTRRLFFKHTLVASDTHTRASGGFTNHPVPPHTKITLAPNAVGLLLVNLAPVARNLVFQTLHVVLELSDLLLHLRLQAVRRARSWRGDLAFDGEGRAALAVVAFRVVGTSEEPGAGLGGGGGGAGGVEGGGLGVAAAVESEDVVVTHC